MHKPEFVLKNKTDNIFSDLEIQTDHQIPTKRPDLVFVKKNHRVKIKENKKRDKYLDLARELKSYET